MGCLLILATFGCGLGQQISGLSHKSKYSAGKAGEHPTLAAYLSAMEIEFPPLGAARELAMATDSHVQKGRVQIIAR